MNKFTWYFSRTPKGNYEDTIISFEPIVTYHKSGKYPYKVYGYSVEAVYGEWYEDTLNINIPSKPVAKFLSKDSIICRYLPLQFKNYSQSFAVKPNFQKNYLWTFGDGTTSSEVEPIHIYNQPGDYTVSLFISNGFCDSTLVKNQYIKVVDAPKPGFQVSDRQGCSPFTANIIDTVSLNVRKKEYFFSDSSIWKSISSQKFTYTFSKPGHYWAVQKLYGYTGCVIKTDSILFYISKGILSTDSISILLTSYDTSNILHLQWSSHPSAVNYEVLKSINGINYSLLIQTSNNLYFDQSIPLNPTFYKVRAIDSCGIFSSSKNIAKPSFISGNRLNDNDAVVMNYSLPLGFGLSNKNDLVAGYNNFSNLSNLQSNPSNPFVDFQFAKEGFLKKCYRLRSEFSGQEMYSNCFCSNFVPKVFIPNVFTPDENGLNELFSPLGLGIVSYSMKIYNRWGEMVFSDSKPWDGKFNNQICMDDVYFYTISLLDNNNNFSLHKGTIRILR